MRAQPDTTSSQPGEAAPPDLHLMRTHTERALTTSPDTADLDTLTTVLRGHMQLMIPEVENLALRRHDTAGISARACVQEARGRLRISNSGEVPAIQVSIVQKLARSVNALCRHYEKLGGSQ